MFCRCRNLFFSRSAVAAVADRGPFPVWPRLCEPCWVRRQAGVASAVPSRFPVHPSVMECGGLTPPCRRGARPAPPRSPPPLSRRLRTSAPITCPPWCVYPPQMGLRAEGGLARRRRAYRTAGVAVAKPKRKRRAGSAHAATRCWVSYSISDTTSSNCHPDIPSSPDTM